MVPLIWLLMPTRLTHHPQPLHLTKDNTEYTNFTYVTLVLRLDAATDAAVAAAVAVAEPAAVADTVDLVSAVVAEVCIIACSC